LSPTPEEEREDACFPEIVGTRFVDKLKRGYRFMVDRDSDKT
jgi:hypothetical protein